MRVTKDHRSRLLSIEPAFERFVERVRVHNVMNHKLVPAQLDDFRLPEMKPRIVSVSQDCCYWGEFLKLKNQPSLADVAGMKDVVNAREQFSYFRIKEVMSIGYDTDAEHEK